MKYPYQLGILLTGVLFALSLPACAETSSSAVSGSVTPAVSAASSEQSLYELRKESTLGGSAVSAPAVSVLPLAIPTPARGSEKSDKSSAAKDKTDGGDKAEKSDKTDKTDKTDSGSQSPADNATVALKQSAFQRFVQQSTGRVLPIYGEQLFRAPSSYEPIGQAPVPNDYILGPGDEIHLQLWGSVDADKVMVIDRHGQIYLPKVGSINLIGVRAGDLEAILYSKIGRIFTNFSLNATLGRLRSIQIYVVGQAQQPGTYTVSSLSTLINALFEVGGPSNTGSMRNIELKRGGRLVGRLDLYDFIARGDRSADIPLQPGDVIVIPPVGPRVAVLGAFEQPAIYELKNSDSIGEVLALGGGLPVIAKTGKALLERIDPGAKAARRVEDFALDQAGLRRTLRDGDILTLFEISPQFANAVTLRGNVAEPLRYPYTPGMRIRDLIPDREALITPDYYRRKNLLVLFDKPDATDVELGVRKLLDEVNWDYAVIQRLDRATLTSRLIPFNLARAVSDGDPEQNLELQPGDIVTILSKNDLRVPQEQQTRLVRVEGEVAAPGIYQVEPGETLPRLLARLGGVTPNAYLYGTEFTRESVRKQQQQNLDTLIRKLESQLQGDLAKQIADAATENDAKARLLAQQQQLERMKAFKSNGRVSLELPAGDVTLAALPALPLEDGDSILVPSRPGFVTAVGEVYNENAIIYRPGRTVGAVLETAGLTENAKEDSAFVLRADGSVKAARDNNGLFKLGGFESLELMPGDTVVIPAKLDSRTGWTKFVAGLKDWTQILYQMGLGAAAWKTIK